MAKITLTNNGPYKISGEDIEIVDNNGSLIEKPEGDVYLCRCGQSSTKPFCDGTHASIQFDSSKGLQDQYTKD
ncbi:CDGSH iron-sulfur domain-containing protein [Patescibacteria group bacterium]|nr:CDGSH iron-sulfur domain-containing protein [Patescibacteria group bacterium]